MSLQKGARACFLVGEYDVETHEGIITVHAWYDSKGWAQYPFARTESDDNSIFPFDLKKYYTVPMVRKRINTKCIEKKTTNGTGLKNRRSPKFVIKEDKNGKIRYDVKGINGEIVFSSQPYDSEKECKEAIARFGKQTLYRLTFCTNCP